MSVFVHPTSVVSPRAEVGEGSHVGPYCTVGDDTHVSPCASLGLEPQDLKYRGEPAETRVGKRCRLREFVTVHRGTEGGGMVTSIGDDCPLLAQAHVAHDN